MRLVKLQRKDLLPVNHFSLCSSDTEVFEVLTEVKPVSPASPH